MALYLNIDSNDPQLIKTLNNKLRQDNTHNFILYYMDGCIHCDITKPEWFKLNNPVLVKENDINSPNIVVASINANVADKIKVGSSPSAFPTIRYITNQGKTILNYEDDTDIGEKNRKLDSFVDWIKSKVHTKSSSSSKSVKGSSKKGGKWTRKYKRSINCKKPKGFSQKQYCKYSRRRK